MKRIRVLIVEDSDVVREYLRRIVAADPRLEVAGTAASGEEALRVLHHVAPDVISMDIRLPGMQGFEATRRIMSERPTPIVVVSGLDPEETNLTMEALKAGAVGAVEKPPAATHQDYAALAGRLCTQLAILSEVAVVRQRPFPDRPPARCHPLHSGPYQVLGIAASTGGPNALMQLLAGLGREFPLPVAVVQHMTPAFVSGFASWLAGVVPFAVRVVTEKMPLVPGTVYVAPPGQHLLANGFCAWTDAGPPVSNHCPSGTVLFESLARHVGRATLGALLTGMGDDGAEGLRQLRAAGGYTIAEHESSAVVYGMPGAAVRLGAACESLPLPEIAPRILQMIAVGQEAD